MDNKKITQQLLDICERLYSVYGPQHWWPAEESFEVMVGAILTQSVSWKNVKKAITNLKDARALSPAALRSLDLDEIVPLIRPCIYYNVKARKLKALVDWMEGYGDDLTKIFTVEAQHLREQLLSVWGIGEETADSIVLYAARKPVFVIDAYTRRIVDRLGLRPEGNKYIDYQSLFTDNLPADAGLFNEYHALLVNHGKYVCKTVPVCRECCLRDICRLVVSE